MSTTVTPLASGPSLSRSEATDGTAWLTVYAGDTPIVGAWSIGDGWLWRTTADEEGPAVKVATEAEAHAALLEWVAARAAGQAQRRIESRWAGMGQTRPRTEAQQREDRAWELVGSARAALADRRGDREHAAEHMAALLVGEPDRDALLPVALVLLAEVAP